MTKKRTHWWLVVRKKTGFVVDSGNTKWDADYTKAGDRTLEVIKVVRA